MFPGVEHRQCMCHLAANFMKKFNEKVYTDNLWPTSLTCSVKKHNYHLRQLFMNPNVKEYLETQHSKLWARSQFCELSKVDYVHNNLAESFNSTIRQRKDHYVVDLLDKIRTCRNSWATLSSLPWWMNWSKKQQAWKWTWLFAWVPQQRYHIWIKRRGNADIQWI